MPKKVDILAVGDVVVDAFIRLKDAHVHCKIDTEECEICMRWGDKIPFDFSEVVPGVGNSANAAVAAARLGLSSALRAYVGSDQSGADCVRALAREGVDTSLVEKAPGKRTNYHFVLWYESERTILVKHEEFAYEAPPALTIAEGGGWLYLSSLGGGSLSYHAALMELLEHYPGTKLAFQPGTYQIAMDKEQLAAVYARSDIFFCNKAEAGRIVGTGSTDDNKHLLAHIQALGPKTVVITDDRKGAYALAGGNYWYIPMYPDPRAPRERTGAGDAFASSIVAALALGKPIEEALLWGPVNAMSVVQEIGAQKGLLTRVQLEKYLADAPTEYTLQSL